MEDEKAMPQLLSGKGPPLLPWMRNPVDISKYDEWDLHQVPFLDPRLQEALQRTGIEALFPVQVAMWHETVGPGGANRDLCICSPTGSGKTLAYALPITQLLSTRILRRLRALIVVPTRDLAMQVKAVFDMIAPSVGLSVGLAVGQTSVVTEAAELVSFPGRLPTCFREIEDECSHISESRIDILVATPGRLMDHVRNTEGFTLEHLQYLVVDEIDRLLREAYQDWLPNVMEAALVNGTGRVKTIRRSGLVRGLKGCDHPRLMKMVLSATITRDPSKIAQLALYHPLHIASTSTDNLYKLPEQLESYKLVCKAEEKPVHLVALLESLEEKQTIVFTSSIESTHRVYLFLSSFEGLHFKSIEYSSLQHQLVRSKSLAAFRSGDVQVLVASDAMARGMDVEGIANIINYDTPAYARTYVHRVGRTARAGRPGSCFTLLRKQEVRHFKSILAKVQNSKCKNYKIPKDILDRLSSKCVIALEKLKDAIGAEGRPKTATPKNCNE